MEAVIAGASGIPLVNVDPALAGALLSPWAQVFFFFFGTIWGSFANVVIYRVPQGKSILRPRSRCPHCDTQVAGYDNIPIVSYLILRGRCRHCREPLAIRYVIVELIAGVLSFALYMRTIYVPLFEGGGPAFAAWSLWFLFALALVVVTYIDLDYWIIPNQIVLPLAGIGVVVAAVVPDALGVDVLEAIGAAAVGFLLFAGIRELYRRTRGIEALGLGDAKLLLMVGAFTGYSGLVWTIGAGALQGLLVSVPLLLLGRRVANTELEDVHGDDPELGEEPEGAGVMGRRVPFGPFLALAALEFVLLRHEIETVLAWLTGVS